jgi:hypothetical protein
MSRSWSQTIASPSNILYLAGPSFQFRPFLCSSLRLYLLLILNLRLRLFLYLHHLRVLIRRSHPLMCSKLVLCCAVLLLEWADRAQLAVSP